MMLVGGWGRVGQVEWQVNRQVEWQDNRQAGRGVWAFTKLPLPVGFK